MHSFQQCPLCLTVCAHSDIRVWWAHAAHRHIGGRKWCMISRVPIPQVSSFPLKQWARTVVLAWGGHTRVAELQARGAPCLCASACAHPPELSPGHMCAQACATRRLGAQEMHPSEVDVLHALGLDYFGCFIGCPLYQLCGCMRGGMKQRAHACCAHARVPPQHAGDGSSLYLLKHKHLCISTAA